MTGGERTWSSKQRILAGEAKIPQVLSQVLPPDPVVPDLKRQCTFPLFIELIKLVSLPSDEVALVTGRRRAIGQTNTFGGYCSYIISFSIKAKS